MTTFFTMAYIVVVNPAILSDGTGMPFGGVLTSTFLTFILLPILYDWMEALAEKHRKTTINQTEKTNTHEVIA